MKLSGTTWTAFFGGLMSLLAALSTLSLATQDIIPFLSPTWTARIAITSAVASFLLKWLNGFLTPDQAQTKP